MDGESSTAEGSAVTPSPAKPARKTPKSKVKEEPKEESTMPEEPPRRVFVGGLEAENWDEASLAEALDKAMGPGLISGLMMATKQRKQLP